jgi:hypothetical protein
VRAVVARDDAVAATDVEDRPVARWRKGAHQRLDAAVAVREPERGVLDRVAVVIALCVGLDSFRLSGRMWPQVIEQLEFYPLKG